MVTDLPLDKAAKLFPPAFKSSNYSFKYHRDTSVVEVVEISLPDRRLTIKQNALQQQEILCFE